MKNWKKLFVVAASLSFLLSFCLLAGVFSSRAESVVQKEELDALPVKKNAAQNHPLSTISQKKTAPLQLQYFPLNDCYVTESDRPVNGLAMGFVLQQKEINGVSLSGINAFSEKKNGISLSAVEMSGDAKGLSMFLVGGNVINNGLSFGIWNMTENNNGLQMGIFNQAEADLMIEYDLKPAEEKSKNFGVQAGLINYSDAPGIQFGLWNTNPNSLIKHFPFFNICL